MALFPLIGAWLYCSWCSTCTEIESFATPSPRLIPEGEKPETFTGLALAPYEGRTWKGARWVNLSRNLPS
jgi:hypothetical protein